MATPQKKRQKIVLDEYNEPIVLTPARRIRRILFAAVVIAFNLFVILLAVRSCDPALSEKVLVSPVFQKNLAQSSLRLPAPGGFSSFSERQSVLAHGVGVYKLYHTNGTDEKGHLQLKNIVWFQGADELQFTLRQNVRYYPRYTGQGDPALSFLVRVIDKTGEERYYGSALTRIAGENGRETYTSAEVHVVTELRGTYLYSRVAFDKIRFDPETDYVTLFVFRTDDLDRTVFSATLSSQTGIRTQVSLAGRKFLFL